MHSPVLLAETLTLLGPKPGQRALDATLGLGGHSEALLNAVLPEGRLIGLDADPRNLESARSKLARFGRNADCIHANFRELPGCLPKGTRQFDLILADLGLSSPHVDDPLRGFSMRPGVPLDMRYNPTSGMSASALLSSLDRTRLAGIFREYGELPRSGTLADAIIEARASGPILMSDDLMAVIIKVYRHSAPKVAPQVFQALRIAVNDEISALQHFLFVAPPLLAPGGRLAVISYHSLEDRLTKQAFRSLTTPKRTP